jgi:hypothetical protein
MIEIDRVEQRFHVSLYGGELRIQVDCRDSDGDPHMVVLSAFAIRDLASKLDEAHTVLLDQLVSQDKMHGYTLFQGPERGNVFAPEGEF